MALTFSETAGVGVEDTATIRGRLASEWQDAFSAGGSDTPLNTDPETPAGQLIDGQAALIAQKDAEMLAFANGFNPRTATGLQQDALAAIYFIQRHIAQATLVTCQCNGLPGTVIPFNSVVQDVNGVNYSSTAPATIPATGTAEIVFAAQQTGPIVAAENTVTKIITVIPGWDTVNNEAAGVTGRDRESQAEFEQRRYESVAANSHGLAESVGGSVYNLPDVVACRIEQNRGNEQIQLMGVTIPPHSVYLSVYGGTSDEIGTVMHEKLDAGCGTAGNTSVTVTDPTNGSEHIYFYTIPETTNLYVQITTAVDALYDSSAVQAAILSNFNGEANYPRAKMGDTIYASRFYQTAIDAGLKDLVEIQVSLTAGSGFGQNVDFNLDQMPVLDASNIAFVEAEE